MRGRVFLHEILWLPLGSADDYLAALEAQFLPAARRFDWQLVGAYRVSQRPRQVLTLFALRNWSDLARLLDARSRDPGLRGWFDYRDRIVQDLHELVLLPARRKVTKETVLQSNAMQVGIFAVLTARRMELEAEMARVDAVRAYLVAAAAIEALQADKRVDLSGMGSESRRDTPAKGEEH